RPDRLAGGADPPSAAAHGSRRLEPAGGLAGPLGAEAGSSQRGVVLSAARIIVHVAPRARRTEVAGRHGDGIRVRIAAPPVNGAANAELTRFLAERLGVPRRAVAIVSGTGGRRQIVEVAGLATGAAIHTPLEHGEGKRARSSSRTSAASSRAGTAGGEREEYRGG